LIGTNDGIWRTTDGGNTYSYNSDASGTSFSFVDNQKGFASSMAQSGAQAFYSKHPMPESVGKAFGLTTAICQYMQK
jgi:hypothetical protein